MAAAIAAATVLGGLLLRPTGAFRADTEGLGLVRDTYEAVVRRVEVSACEGTDPGADIFCRYVTTAPTQGPDAGGTVVISMSDTATSPELEPGDHIVLSFDAQAGEGFRYQYADRQRRPVLLWLGIAFAVTVVLLGRLRGLAASPAILDGRSPLLVAVVGASLIAFLAIYLAHGFTLMSTVALLGTVASLALTAGLAQLFVELAQLSGFASEEAIIVQVGAADLDLAGLILGGVVIGALGAIDDMTVTQASAVWELHAANPRLGRDGLLRAGLRIGRDHVASTVNTLVLAYAGASMPILVLFVLSEQSLGTVANGETVATEIIRTLVGSIGLVAAVPVTTWIAARAVGGTPEAAEAA